MERQRDRKRKGEGNREAEKDVSKKPESEGVRAEVKEGDRSARESVCERTQRERQQGTSDGETV